MPMKYTELDKLIYSIIISCTIIQFMVFLALITIKRLKYDIIYPKSENIPLL